MIAVVVPTIRPESYERFCDEWQDIFEHHNVTLVPVFDGDDPECMGAKLSEEPQEVQDLIYNKNDGVRNYGFIKAAQAGAKYILTLDDDVYPGEKWQKHGIDPIMQHILILNSMEPISWLSTSEEVFMRGFPYGIREEAEVLVSHGVWDNVPDYDAATQLVCGADVPKYRRTIVPKGIYFPFCIMNVMFDIRALPYMYQAPMRMHNLDRFADIWCGINLVRDAAKENFAIATGYSTIWHDRASNVFENLIKEAHGIRLNETYWKGDESHEYFKLYNEKREKWKKLTSQLIL